MAVNFAKLPELLRRPVVRPAPPQQWPLVRPSLRGTKSQGFCQSRMLHRPRRAGRVP